MEKKSETRLTMVPGTEHIYAGLERFQHLLDFIDKETVMKSLLHRVNQAEKAEGIVTDSYSCFGDGSGQYSIYLKTRRDGNTLKYVTGLDYGHCDGSDDEGWFIANVEKDFTFTNVFIGETLDIEKIIRALKLNGHDRAELIVEAQERDER